MAKKKKAAKKKARRTPTRRTPRKTVKKVRRPAKKVARVKAPRPAAPSVKLVVAEIDRLLESLKGRRSVRATLAEGTSGLDAAIAELEQARTHALGSCGSATFDNADV
jgi:hypothetical protein